MSNINDSHDREVTIDKSLLRPWRQHEQDAALHFQEGQFVEVCSLPNHPEIKHKDIQGWRRAVIANAKGKYLSLEFDQDRHPMQLPQIFTNGEVRHESYTDVNAHLDSLSRVEIVISPPLV